jgi:hypothetical protein
MKVEWLNFKLTFQAETPAEHESLMAVWAAFGSQIDDRPGVDDYELASRELPDPSTAQSLHSMSD